MFSLHTFFLNKEAEKDLKGVFCSKNPKIEDLVVRKAMENRIDIAFILNDRYDVWIHLFIDREIDFVHINGNSHTKIAKEKYDKEIKAFCSELIKKSPDRLRLLS